MLYTKRQTDLLRESIGKWVHIVCSTGDDEGTENCALCREYYDGGSNIYDYGCKSCPVFIFTDKSECANTPYWDWVKANPKMTMPYENVNDETMDAAKKELKFLEDLYNKTILFRKFEV